MARVFRSKGQLQRKIKRDALGRAIPGAAVSTPAYVEGTVHLGPNWSIGEDELGQLVAHNVITGQRVVLGAADEGE